MKRKIMDNLKGIIESILFVAGDSVALFDIADKLNVELEEIKTAILELQNEKIKSESGIQVLMFNDKAQLSSNSNYADQIAEVLNPIKEKALTKAVLEVCAIIAYKQPITRLEVENIRGVNSDYAINVLIENNLIEVVGRKDAVGKPLLFGTTDNFLKKFDLHSLNDLPDYNEVIERIKVLHEKSDDNSLFNFTDYAQQQDDEQNNEELNNQLTDEKEDEIIKDLENLKQDVEYEHEELKSDIDEFLDNSNLAKY